MTRAPQTTVLERVLATHQTLHCPTRGAAMVTKLDAIARTVTRCPRCDRVAPTRWRQPDEGLVPQTLVRVSPLPAVRDGQLRCQRCAHGVEGQMRFCGACTADRTRGAQTTRCLGCGRTSPRLPGKHAVTARCAACPDRAPRGTKSARTYPPRLCAFKGLLSRTACGMVFTPTGPAAKFCETHRGHRA